MKKVLALIPLVAGMAMAETETTPSPSDRVLYETEVTYGDNGFAEITTSHGGESITVGKPAFTCEDATTGQTVSFIGDTHTIGVDVGSGAGFTLTLDFPVSTAYSSYTINNISLVLGLNNEDGTPYPYSKYQTANGGELPKLQWSVKVIQEGKVIATSSRDLTLVDTGAPYFTTGFYYGPDREQPSIELTGPFSLEITITGYENQQQAPFYIAVDKVGVMGMAPMNYEQVPEPTTATLSLLALASLAARRRRQ